MNPETLRRPSPPANWFSSAVGWSVEGDGRSVPSPCINCHSCPYPSPTLLDQLVVEERSSQLVHLPAGRPSRPSLPDQPTDRPISANWSVRPVLPTQPDLTRPTGSCTGAGPIHPQSAAGHQFNLSQLVPLTITAVRSQPSFSKAGQVRQPICHVGTEPTGRGPSSPSIPTSFSLRTKALLNRFRLYQVEGDTAYEKPDIGGLDSSDRNN